MVRLFYAVLKDLLHDHIANLINDSIHVITLDITQLGMVVYDEFLKKGQNTNEL